MPLNGPMLATPPAYGSNPSGLSLLSGAPGGSTMFTPPQTGQQNWMPQSFGGGASSPQNWWQSQLQSMPQQGLAGLFQNGGQQAWPQFNQAPQYGGGNFARQQFYNPQSAQQSAAPQPHAAAATQQPSLVPQQAQAQPVGNAVAAPQAPATQQAAAAPQQAQAQPNLLGNAAYGKGGLIKSPSKSAFKANVADMIRSGHPRDQALAAAYNTARKSGAHFALGGSPDYFAHRAAMSLNNAGMHPPGLIKSSVAGRTDQIHALVPSGSYVVPSDHVSHLGQGNTLAGGQVLDRMLQAPGMTHLHSNIPQAPHPMRFAKGGRAALEGKPVNIIVAGGEYLLHPAQVRRADEIVNKLPPGTGDLKRGHDALDHWITSERKKHVRTLTKLPPPKK